MIAYRRQWRPSLRECRRDATYMPIGFLAGGLASIAAFRCVDDLGTYGFHYIAHPSRWLWREHGIHHVTQKVNILNFITAHVIDVFCNSCAALVPMMVLGFSPEAVFATICLRAMQTFASHANLNRPLAWYHQVLMGPQHHRLHHRVDLEQAGNYGTITTIWDRIFGTYADPWTNEAQCVGVSSPNSFPPTMSIARSLRYGFVGK